MKLIKKERCAKTETIFHFDTSLSLLIGT